jgi:competence protein ComEC
MTAVTLVAQAGTLSLTIMLFNQFPVWFIISNIIIVPLSSFLIIIGCLVPLTFPVEFLSGFFASTLGYLTGLTETLTRVVSLLPLSVIQNIGLTKAESILLIITIFLWMAYILYKESFSILVPAASLFLFFMAGTIKGINNNSAGELIVYNSVNSSSIGIKTGNKMILLTDTIPVNSDVIRHCSTRGLKLKAISFSNDPVFIETGGKKILICNSLNDRIIRLTNPETVILARPHPRFDKQIPVSNPVKNIIISSGVSQGFQLPLKLITEDIDTVHYVKKSGAFIVRL